MVPSSALTFFKILVQTKKWFLLVINGPFSAATTTCLHLTDNSVFQSISIPVSKASCREKTDAQLLQKKNVDDTKKQLVEDEWMI
jgi:hypothetical protein